MANGHVEIHDPLSNHRQLKRRRSEEEEEAAALRMKDTVEFRLLMVYATRRRGDGRTPANGAAWSDAPLSGRVDAERTEEEEEKDEDVEEEEPKKPKKKRKGWKRLFRCIRPQTDDAGPESRFEPRGDPLDRGFRRTPAAAPPTEVHVDQELENAAARLAQIAAEIPFTPPVFEVDSPDDDLERTIGLLLRETGDRLNEQELRDLSLVREFFWNYAFFKKVMVTLLSRMTLLSSEPDSLGPQASTKTLIAVTCEATTRLTAMDTLPMNRLLGYGARYLNEEFSSWAQEQGGYDEAFLSDDEDDK